LKLRLKKISNIWFLYEDDDREDERLLALGVESNRYGEHWLVHAPEHAAELLEWASAHEGSMYRLLAQTLLSDL
jgi:hypothetical protein